jgi:adiponectin receptor
MIEKQDLLPNATIGNLNDDHKFLQDNEFIHAGYRLYFNSFRKICRSLFMWHNESFNIWSHLLGFMLFLSFLVYSVFFLKLNGEISLFSAGNDAFGQAFQVVKSFEHVSQDIKSEIDSERFDWILPRLLNTRLQPVSRWPLFVFILSAMICLSMSTVYHLFSAHSRRIYALTSRLDYAGISILIAGSFFPPIYYIYFCREGIF